VTLKVGYVCQMSTLKVNYLQANRERVWTDASQYFAHLSDLKFGFLL